MKTTLRVLSLSLVLTAVLVVCHPVQAWERHPYAVAPVEEEPPAGCTVVSMSKGDRVFFGGNDDYIEPDSYYWVERGRGDNYGIVWIGTPDNVQQGVNEMGLAYDANGLPEIEMNVHRERIPWAGGITDPQMHILRECATVQEVIEWVQTHQVYPRMNDQRQYADAGGDAVLISPGPDGELVFTRKKPGNGYLVSTNFNVIDPAHGYGYPCWRYDTAHRVLDDLMASDDPLTVEDAASVFDAVHVEGATSWTIATLVADLPNGLIYLYFFYQFDQPVVIDVAQELAHPHPPGPLSRLFPEEVQQEGARRYTRIQNQSRRCRWMGMAWVGLVLACLVLVVAANVRRLRALWLWAPAVAVLGPLGLLAWLLVERTQKPGRGRTALLEAIGDLTPATLAFALYLALALWMPDVMGSTTAQLALILGLPPLLGGLLFQGGLLALATGRGCLQTLWQRAPHAWVAANLGVAGLIALSSPLVQLCTRTCSFFPTPGWSVGLLWASVVLGALAGGLLLWLFQWWAVRHGQRAWSAVSSGEGEYQSLPWRRLWWWIPLSYAALVGGLMISVLSQQMLAA